MRETLDERDVAPDPFRQFERWFDEAVKAEIREAERDDAGHGGCRWPPVGAHRPAQGRRRATDSSSSPTYASRKGRELAQRAARRRCSSSGPSSSDRCESRERSRRVGDAESTAYFASRPRPARLGAWASPQSEAIAAAQRSRRVFEADGSALSAMSAMTIPLPPHWGGYPARARRCSSSGRAARRGSTIASAIDAIRRIPSAGSSIG